MFSEFIKPDMSSASTDIMPLLPYCDNVTDTLSLQGKKSGVLRFQSGMQGWSPDCDIKIHYTINIIQPHWQDSSTYEEINITQCDFEGHLGGVKIGMDKKSQEIAEVYLIQKGFDIIDEVRKAYNGE